MSPRAAEVRAARAEDIDALLADMRPADFAEGEALLGPGRVREGVESSIAASVHAWALEVDGGLMCLFGVSPINIMAGQGAPWMLGTTLVERHPRALTRFTPPYIARMLAVFPHLVNVVDARNTRSIGWLRRVGFTVLPARPMGCAGLPFHPFYRDA
jgi:hypothetical protein